MSLKTLGTNPSWKLISGAVNRLFTLKRYPELAVNLSSLNENVRALSKSEVAPFISDYYIEQILNPCMEMLLKEIAQERDTNLINKMADIWTQFYTSILPTLLAFFASIQPQQNKLSIRSLTLLSFRDCVVLKTKLAVAVQRHKEALPPQIQQMLLVLQSIHRNPPDDRFFVLQDIVGTVVESYFPMVTKSQVMTSPMQGIKSDSRNIRSGTMDPLESSSERQVQSSGSVNRRHSVGLVDSEEPVTRL